MQTIHIPVTLMQAKTNKVGEQSEIIKGIRKSQESQQNDIIFLKSVIQHGERISQILHPQTGTFFLLPNLSSYLYLQELNNIATIHAIILLINNNPVKKNPQTQLHTPTHKCQINNKKKNLQKRKRKKEMINS